MGKNRGIEGSIKNIYADGLARIEIKGRKPIYAWLRQLEKVYDRVCDYCGDKFNPSRSDPRIRFCSSECRYKNEKKMKSIGGRNYWTPVDGISPKKCPICSRTFYHNKRKYCSDSCSYKANSHQYRKIKFTAQGFIARRCPGCTLSFVTNQLIRKFCSEECAKRYKLHKIIKKGEICKHIYDSKDDPDSISDLIEDWSGIHCPVKDKEESDGLSRE